MFESLVKFERIFVTGPQRSGTRICAKMIASDTSFEFIDEMKFGYSNIGKALDICNNKFKFVLHCPALSAYIHNLATAADLVVFMIRPLAEIEKSQKRIDWKNEGIELSKYGLLPCEGPIAKVKQDNWNDLQKPLVKNWLDQKYVDLSSHPLWVDSEERRDWNWRQTTKDEFIKNVL